MILLDKLSNIYDKEWCQRHKKKPLRILDLLRKRELEIRRPGSDYICGSREFYQCFKMECTSIMQPSSLTPIRFTPDGQQLIQFNMAANDVVVSWYNGVTSVRNPSGPKAQDLLTKHFSVQVQGTLCRDLCLVTADSRHMVIGHVVQTGEASAIITRNFQNNESSAVGFNLEHTTIIVVDLKKGLVCDSVRLEFDSIKVSSGVYLVDRLLGILSVQHQTIHLYKIDENNGSLSKVIDIGRSLFEDDEFYLNAIPSNPRIENVFLGFRNRFINFLYSAHKRAGTSIGFLRSIHHYLSLKIHKMQLIGPDILFLRLGSGTGSDTNRKEEEKNFCMFVLFDWRQAEILAAYNLYADTLFKLFVNNTESFQNGYILDNSFPTTMEHCHILRKQQHDNIIDALVASSTPESANRVRNRTLNMLPCTGAGIPMFTPFLDAHSFSFDERLLTCIERGRLSTNIDFRIYCRKTCSLVLSIDFSKYTDQESPCRIIFHPTDPLLLLSKHYCSDSPTHVFTPPLAGNPVEVNFIPDPPGPSSRVT